MTLLESAPTPPPAMGNTGGLIRHKTWCSACHEDTVNLSVWFDNEQLTELFERLEMAKNIAQKIGHKIDESEDETRRPRIVLAQDGTPFLIGEFQQPDEEEYHLPGTVDFGGECFVVKARGFGGEEGKPYFEYVLQSRGITIALRNDQPRETIPNGLIELGSIPLTLYGGLPNLWPEVLKLLETEKIELLRHVVGRYDLCMDMIEAPFLNFYKRYTKGKWISRARKWDESCGQSRQHGSGADPTGFSRGVALRLNCYDKIRELEDKGDMAKFEDLVYYKWGQKIPHHVTRVEFQCKRDALKAFLIEPGFRIDTVEDCIKHRASLWGYLTTKFFRMLQGKVDKKNRHHDRAKTWSLWEKMQKQGIKSLQGDVCPVKRMKRRSPTNLEALGKQAVGCTIKQAAYLEKKLSNPLEVMQTFFAQLDAMTLDELEARVLKASERIREDNLGVSLKMLRSQMHAAYEKTEELIRQHAETITLDKIKPVFVKSLNHSIRTGLYHEATDRARRNHITSSSGRKNSSSCV